MELANKERVGDKAVRLGFLSAEALEAALEQHAAERGAAGTQSPLGLFLLERGLISAAQLGQLLGRSPDSTKSLRDESIQLAAQLAARLDEQTRIVMVVPFGSQSGTTSVVSQLGMALTLMDHAPILLVDANAGRAHLHQQFDVPLAPGLSEYLTADAAAHEVVHEAAITGLSVLPCGDQATQAGSRLMAEHGIYMLRRLSDDYRLVILDCPPLEDFPEATWMAQRVDGVIAVIAAGAQRASEISRFRDALSRVGARLLGGVLTSAGDTRETP